MTISVSQIMQIKKVYQSLISQIHRLLLDAVPGCDLWMVELTETYLHLRSSRIRVVDTLCSKDDTSSRISLVFTYEHSTEQHVLFFERFSTFTHMRVDDKGVSPIVLRSSYKHINGLGGELHDFEMLSCRYANESASFKLEKQLRDVYEYVVFEAVEADNVFLR